MNTPTVFLYIYTIDTEDTKNIKLLLSYMLSTVLFSSTIFAQAKYMYL